MGIFNLKRGIYAKKKILYKCVFCKKYKAIKKGLRGSVQRFKCLSCNKWFNKNLQKKLKIQGIDINELILNHLKGSSYRSLENEYGINKKRLCLAVNDSLSKLKSNLEVTKYFKKEIKYSGILVIDGKYIPVKEDETIDFKDIFGKRKSKSKKRRKALRGKVLIWGCDYVSHDIMHYEFGDYESTFKYNQYFRRLKELDYPLKSVTADDKQEIQKAVLRIYPTCIIQLCTYHYLKRLNTKLKVALIKRQIKALEKRIGKLFETNTANTRDYVPYSRKWTQEELIRLTNRLLGLEFKYELLIDFEDIIKSIILAKDFKIANDRYNYLINIFWKKRFKMRDQFDKDHINIVKKLITDFKSHKENLTNYLKYPHLNIPRTTNLVEGLNSQLELRLNSIKGFESIKTASNYLNAWIVKRRFTKFTDCRKNFKSLNKKTPLECSNVDISNIHSWLEFFKE